jgi:hypothetical protein
VEAVALSPLVEWESYYVIVGSSAGALTGLQFVVMALVAEGQRRASDQEINAFGTPNVVHFCAALLVSAVLSAPWHGLGGPALVLAACGIAGIAYVVAVVRRARRQTGYQPVLEDWVWHGALPFVAYTALLAATPFLRHHPTESLFVVAGASLLLVFVGIHNSWDTVTFLALQGARKPRE